MLIFDLVPPAELVGFARGLEFDDYRLDAILPAVNVEDISVAWNETRRVRPRAAMYRAFGAASDLGVRGASTERVTVDLPPVSQRIRLMEEQRLRLESLRRNRADVNADPALVEAIFDDVAAEVEAVVQRIELARGEVLFTGQVTFQHDRGLITARDYGVPASHFPTAGVLWSDHTNATALTDMQGWLDIFELDAKIRPVAIGVPNRDVFTHLLLNAEVRAILEYRGIQPALAGQDELNQVLSLYGIPPLRFMEREVVRIEDTETDVLPSDQLLFIPPTDTQRTGMVAHGITAPAIELVERGQIRYNDAAGLVAVVYQESVEPWVRATKAEAIALPVIRDPNRIMAPTVL